MLARQKDQPDLIRLQENIAKQAGKMNLENAATDASKAAQALRPARTQAAEDRGAAMTLETAAEFAVMLTAPDLPAPQQPPGLAQLSAGNRNWSPWSPRAAPTPRSPGSCTSA